MLMGVWVCYDESISGVGSSDVTGYEVADGSSLFDDNGDVATVLWGSTWNTSLVEYPLGWPINTFLGFECVPI